MPVRLGPIPAILRRLLTGPGQLVGATAASTPVAIPAPADGEVLVGATGEAAGVEWRPLAAADVGGLGVALAAKADAASLGSAAYVATTAFDAAGSAAAAQGAAIAASLQRASNLSDLANAATARTNLGLGGAALLNVGTGAGTVAAGNDARMTDDRTANAIRETSGPTLLAVGDIGEGQFFKRVGSTVVGAAAMSGGGALPLDAQGFPTSVVAGQLRVARPVGALALSGGNLALGFFYGHHCVFGKARTVITLGVAVGGNVANAVGRVAVYATNANGYPTSLVGYSNEINVATNGIRTAAAAASFAVTGSDLYFIAWLPGVAAGNLSCPNAGSGGVYGFNASGSTDFRYGLKVAQAYGVPPATFPAGAVTTINVECPVPLYDFAAV